MRLLKSAILTMALLLVQQTFDGRVLAQVAPKPDGEAVDMAELMKPPSPLFGDVPLGRADAPVTVIEYASLTCTHCAGFHRSVMRQFKERYVDTGQVRFIYRAFPLNALDLGAYTVARCRGEGSFVAMVDLLFSKQESWAFVSNPLAALVEVVKEAGFTQESVDACLKNRELSDALNASGDAAYEKLGVDSTPTFFINGNRYVGALNLAEIDAIIAPLLKK
jgi:protein-disulfide isomerase